MSNLEVKAAVKQLVDSINNSDALKDDDRSQLLELAQDLENLLRPAETPSLEEDLSDRLQRSTEQFEAEHPDLTAAISRISYLLSNMGI